MTPVLPIYGPAPAPQPGGEIAPPAVTATSPHGAFRDLVQPSAGRAKAPTVPEEPVPDAAAAEAAAAGMMPPTLPALPVAAPDGTGSGHPLDPARAAAPATVLEADPAAGVLVPGQHTGALLTSGAVADLAERQLASGPLPGGGTSPQASGAIGTAGAQSTTSPDAALPEGTPATVLPAAPVNTAAHEMPSGGARAAEPVREVASTAAGASPALAANAGGGADVAQPPGGFEPAAGAAATAASAPTVTGPAHKDSAAQPEARRHHPAAEDRWAASGPVPHGAQSVNDATPAIGAVTALVPQGAQTGRANGEAAGPRGSSLIAAQQRVAAEMAALVRVGGGDAEIELSPPELGRVRLKLAVRNRTVHGSIEVESVAVKQMLENSMDRLQVALERQGLQFEGVEVRLQDAPRDRERDGRPAQPHTREPRGQGERPPGGSGGREPAPRHTGSGLVDYWL